MLDAAWQHVIIHEVSNTELARRPFAGSVADEPIEQSLVVLLRPASVVAAPPCAVQTGPALPCPALPCPALPCLTSP